MWENVQSTEGKDCYLKFLEESGSDGGWSDIFRAEVLNWAPKLDIQGQGKISVAKYQSNKTETCAGGMDFGERKWESKF